MREKQTRRSEEREMILEVYWAPMTYELYSSFYHHFTQHFPHRCFPDYRQSFKKNTNGRILPADISSCCCCCCIASVVSDSVRPHRRQPTRLPRPWDSPGKSTGVGCHFLLQCTKVKSESEVTQSHPTLCDPVDCSPPGSPVHGNL